MKYLIGVLIITLLIVSPAMAFDLKVGEPMPDLSVHQEIGVEALITDGGEVYGSKVHYHDQDGRCVINALYSKCNTENPFIIYDFRDGKATIDRNTDGIVDGTEIPTSDKILYDNVPKC